MTASAAPSQGMPKRDRLVIVASSLGTVFEWYDFFLYGALAGLLGVLFFPAGNPTTALLASLATFGAGFLVRPFGAIVFGWLGDKVGRKYTFLITITLMGGATAAIGLLPTYEQIGIAAAALLLTLRLLQGLALGGEYGGAAIYVAEHAPDGKRGYYTSFIQVSVAAGFILALAVILGVRHAMGPDDFREWGWRIPFLISLVMLAISIWIRMMLSESPVFAALKAAGKTSRNPFVESFSTAEQAGKVLVAMLGVAAGLTVIYYTSQFGTLYFLQNTARLPEETAQLYVGLGALIAAPLFVFFGWLSDKVGRKLLLCLGYGLTLILLFPAFHWLEAGANPALARAQANAPVTIAGADCRFDVFAAKQATPCGQALAFLAKRGISYTIIPSTDGTDVTLKAGPESVSRYDEKAFTEALARAGYPQAADPAEMNIPLLVGAIALLVGLSAMTYGMAAAILVEMFPARIRYTSLSVPYHIGTGYFGGFLPFISQYVVATTGDAYAGFWYAWGVVLMALVIVLLFLPETRHKDIHAHD
jgi:nitrate/nitrite transporter NarK